MRKILCLVVLSLLFYANSAWAGSAAAIQEQMSFCNPARFSTSQTGSTLSTAIASTGSQATPDCSGNSILTLTPGVWAITGNLTIPARMTLRVPDGAYVSVSAGVTLTINGPVDADAGDWFYGDGTVTFNYPISSQPAAYAQSGCTPADPGSGLTLAAFACNAFVTHGNSMWPVYQASSAVTIPDSATVCVGIYRVNTDTETPSGWTGVSGTHYMYQAAACSSIAAQDGVLKTTEVTVVASNIDTVTNFAFRSLQDARERVHRVTSWGAVADSGTTDNTTALQNALNALVNIGDTLVFPCTIGSYYGTTASLTVPTTDGISIIGENPASPKCAPVGLTTAGEDFFRITETNAQNNVTIAGISFEGGGTARYAIKTGTTSGQGLDRSNIVHCNFNNWAGAGIGIFNSLLLNIHNNFFTNNTVGILEVNGSFTGPNGYSVVGNQFEINGIGISANELRGWDLSGNTFEANTTGGIKVNIAEGMHFAGNYFEGNYTAAGGGTYYDVYIGATSFVSGVTLHGNFYGGLATYTDDYVPVRVKFSKGLDAKGESVANGSRYFKADGGASLRGVDIGDVAFINGAFAATGADASFNNLPSDMWSIGARNRISQLSNQVGVISQNLVRHGQILLTLANTTEPTPAGTGASDDNGANGIAFTTGATSSSRIERYASLLGLSRGIAKENLNYTKEQEWTFVFEPASGTTNGESWIYVGAATAAADPATHAYGIKWDNLALKGLAHNGTVLDEVDLSVTMTAGDLYTVRMVLISSILYWYVNGVQVGTSAGVSAATDATANLLMGAANNADSAAQAFTILDVKYRVTQ